eukprot:gnl/TRDRNA2_/TRDRNA2_176518_c0_seq1.p1 gnl/TRDRNA2_/TRDRNA2_176518_c0~~gnl/TRDRNA2_/TRDRNA2_176518_c0_seq1.p1  ORF type:complete len:471 (+),score=60.59 gnl/TRDRNA2_/TRDRNA2_176518_c0_seq1:60-1472(+)
MYRATVIALLALTVQVRGEKLDKLIHRALSARPFHAADLDYVMFGKPSGDLTGCCTCRDCNGCSPVTSVSGARRLTPISQRWARVECCSIHKRQPRGLSRAALPALAAPSARPMLVLPLPWRLICPDPIVAKGARTNVVHATRQFHTETKYQVIAFKTRERLAQDLQASHPERFEYHATSWDKFSDSGLDHIIVGGFQPENVVRGSHVLFLADFHNNDVTLSQFHVLTMLCESFVSSLTIYLPYFPTATLDRVEIEGEVATANTMSRFLSSLPAHGVPARVMLYDLHSLQNRFFLHTGALATLHSAIPQLRLELQRSDCPISGLAFPDEGAQKRFAGLLPDFEPVTCGKKRIGGKRQVLIQDGASKLLDICEGKHMLIVDDMVKSGGTLTECAKALKRAGAAAVSAYVTHAAFPAGGAQRFCEGGDFEGVFSRFYVTDSNPLQVDQIKEIPEEKNIFHVIRLLPQVLKDL